MKVNEVTAVRLAPGVKVYVHHCAIPRQQTEVADKDLQLALETIMDDDVDGDEARRRPGGGHGRGRAASRMLHRTPYKSAHTVPHRSHSLCMPAQGGHLRVEKLNEDVG